MPSTPGGLGKKGVRAGIEGKTQSKNEHASKDSSKDQANQVETVIFLAQAVAQDSPAKSGTRRICSKMLTAASHQP